MEANQRQHQSQSRQKEKGKTEFFKVQLLICNFSIFDFQFAIFQFWISFKIHFDLILSFFLSFSFSLLIFVSNLSFFPFSQNTIAHVDIDIDADADANEVETRQNPPPAPKPETHPPPPTPKLDYRQTAPAPSQNPPFIPSTPQMPAFSSADFPSLRLNQRSMMGGLMLGAPAFLPTANKHLIWFGDCQRQGQIGADPNWGNHQTICFLWPQWRKTFLDLAGIAWSGIPLQT